MALARKSYHCSPYPETYIHPLQHNLMRAPVPTVKPRFNLEHLGQNGQKCPKEDNCLRNNLSFVFIMLPSSTVGGKVSSSPRSFSQLALMGEVSALLPHRAVAGSSRQTPTPSSLRRDIISMINGGIVIPTACSIFPIPPCGTAARSGSTLRCYQEVYKARQNMQSRSKNCTRLEACRQYKRPKGGWKVL